VLNKLIIIQNKERDKRLITSEFFNPQEQATPHNLRFIVYQALELRRVLPTLYIPEEVKKYLYFFIKDASFLV
jgi:hypothetical protein